MVTYLELDGEPWWGDEHEPSALAAFPIDLPAASVDIGRRCLTVTVL